MLIYQKLGYSVDILSADNKLMVLSAKKGGLSLKITYALTGQALQMTTRVWFGSYRSEETKTIDDWEADLACCLPVPVPLDKEAGINIYPRQIDTEAYLTLYNTTVPQARVQIINTKGKTVLDTQMETCGLLHWDTTNLSTGKYLVRILINGKHRYNVVKVSGSKQELAGF